MGDKGRKVSGNEGRKKKSQCGHISEEKIKPISQKKKLKGLKPKGQRTTDDIKERINGETAEQYQQCTARK